MFKEDQKHLQTWITACNVKFASQPSHLVTEHQKLTFTTSFLKRLLLLWVNTHLNIYLKVRPNDSITEEFASFNAFTQSLCTLYRDSNLKRNSLKALDNLKQLGTVANYISDSAIHAPHANLNDTRLRQAFYKGLKKGTKDKLTMHDYKTLKKLQN